MIFFDKPFKFRVLVFWLLGLMAHTPFSDLSAQIPGSNNFTEPSLGETAAERSLIEMSRISSLVEPRIGEEEWRRIVGDFQQSYTIQKNDNLWDISSELFGSGYYWPKVWAVNGSQIGNPHLVYPDQSIRFFASAESPPSLSIGNEEDLPELMANDDEPQALDTSIIEAPSSSAGGSYPEISRDPLKSAWKNYIPRNSIFTRDYSEKPENPEIPNDIETFQDWTVSPSFFSQSFMQDEEIEPLGTILATSFQGTQIPPGESIFLNLEQTVPAGTRLSIFQTERYEKPRFSDRVGIYYDIIGEVIAGPIRGGKQIGTVSKGFKSLKREYPVMSFVRPKPLPPKRPAEQRIESVVIQSAGSKARFLSMGRLIILDRGSEDGVQVGNVFEIYDRKDLKNGEVLPISKSTFIGEVIAMDTKERYTTALITFSKRDIEVGSFAITQPDKALSDSDLSGDFEGDELDAFTDDLETLPEEESELENLEGDLEALESDSELEDLEGLEEDFGDLEAIPLEPLEDSGPEEFTLDQELQELDMDSELEGLDEAPLPEESSLEELEGELELPELSDEDLSELEELSEDAGLPTGEEESLEQLDQIEQSELSTEEDFGTSDSISESEIESELQELEDLEELGAESSPPEDTDGLEGIEDLEGFEADGGLSPETDVDTPEDEFEIF
jgi:hypothetical protein